jgi:hypothetical protein
MNPTTISLWLQVLQGLLTPVIGLTTLYIAWQQWRGARFKLRLERYERRLGIYQRLVAFVRLVARDFKPAPQDIFQLSADTAEADFLFGDDIPAYIFEICKRAWELHSARAEYRDMFQAAPEGYDHQKVVSVMHEQEVWFTSQLAEMREKFKKYLDVGR